MTYEIEVQVHEKIVLPSILKQQQVKYTGGPSQIGSDTNFTTKQFWCSDIFINLFNIFCSVQKQVLSGKKLKYLTK